MAPRQEEHSDAGPPLWFWIVAVIVILLATFAPWPCVDC